MRLGLAQIEAARHAMTTPRSARESKALPDRCAGVDQDHCAEQGGEWQSRGTMADPKASICMGCRHERSGVA